MGYYGDPSKGCNPCTCHVNGSMSDICDSGTGQCDCQSKFTGRRCDNCQTGYSFIELGCVPCDCNLGGSENDLCNPNTGQCNCKSGVNGIKCDYCSEGYFGLSEKGCQGKKILQWFFLSLFTVIYYSKIKYNF